MYLIYTKFPDNHIPFDANFLYYAYSFNKSNKGTGKKI